jgi:hypothetical protein
MNARHTYKHSEPQVFDVITFFAAMEKYARLADNLAMRTRIRWQRENKNLGLLYADWTSTELWRPTWMILPAFTQG